MSLIYSITCENNFTNCHHCIQFLHLFITRTVLEHKLKHPCFSYNLGVHLLLLSIYSYYSLLDFKACIIFSISSILPLSSLSDMSHMTSLFHSVLFILNYLKESKYSEAYCDEYVEDSELSRGLHKFYKLLYAIGLFVYKFYYFIFTSSFYKCSSLFNSFKSVTPRGTPVSEEVFHLDFKCAIGVFYDAIIFHIINLFNKYSIWRGD